MDVQRLTSETCRGLLLYGVIDAAFRQKGTSLGEWCYNQNVSEATARRVVCGVDNEPSDKALLKLMIESAGLDVVWQEYAGRIGAVYERIIDTGPRDDWH